MSSAFFSEPDFLLIGGGQCRADEVNPKTPGTARSPNIYQSPLKALVLKKQTDTKRSATATSQIEAAVLYQNANTHAGKTVTLAKIKVVVWSGDSFEVKMASGHPKNGKTPSAAQTPKTVLPHYLINIARRIFCSS